jgi:outer membrane protein TolC
VQDGSDLAMARVERTVDRMKSRIVALLVLLAVGRQAAAQIPGVPAPAAPRPSSDTERPTPSIAPQTPGNPFLGSAPKDTTTTAEPVRLSVKDAVERALKNNLGLLLQEESASAARGARWRALADLLPDVSGSVSERRQVINLEAFGFNLKPSIVGPFNVFDARVFLSQPVLDLSATNDARAASLNLKAERFGVKSARDLVVLVAVNLYLEAITADSRVETTRAQQDTADALLTQAQDLKTNGIVAGIDVLRAQVQLQTQKQRLIAARNDFEKLKLQLARAIGIPVGQPFVLTDRIPYAPLPALTLDEALARALESRPDYLAARSRFEAAQASRRAANGALLPSIHVDADFGAIGQTVETAHSTYTLGASLRVPVFDGGRTTARRIETEAVLRQREAELADFKGRIEYEVRAALLDVQAAEQQLEAAQTNRQLAGEELQQARDRFSAGVASNIEVTQAQESVAAASENYIAALYAHNLAKASLARALGIAESAVTGYLGGLQ